MPMSNSMRLVRNRLADADEGAERAGERRRHRQEERQRRVDVIIAAGEVVPELVTAEDRENRDAVPEAGRAQALVSGTPAARSTKSARKAEVVPDAGERRRGDRQDEQQDVQPDPILKLRSRLPEQMLATDK